MNYAKVIGSALKLFPKKINVTLIDAATGNRLGKYKLLAELLPNAFNRPVTLVINNTRWRVLEAEPLLADDFLFTKKLTLRVQPSESEGVRELNFDLPSKCSEVPATGVTCLYDDFTLEVSESDWRQVELLPISQSDSIEQAVKEVENILNSQPNPLLGYEQQYIRDNALQPELTIPFDEFCTLLINPVKGNILFNNNGFVQHGFALRSDSYTYYGIIENEHIKTLCLRLFEWADDEFMRVLSTYGLCLVNWCNAVRISAEAGETPKSQYIDI
ncbi:MAG: hypothetical protein J7621_21935 [Niastella sp.]|nr:hypothetical protein [Niastella sp.]